MNILNEHVCHVVYGDGNVVSLESNVLTVQFSGQEEVKKFIYPDAFEKHLRLNNSDAEEGVLKELQEKQAVILAEEDRRRREHEEAVERDKQARAIAAAPKRKTSAKKKAVGE
jgi:hypothetical protein